MEIDILQTKHLKMSIKSITTTSKPSRSEGDLEEASPSFLTQPPPFVKIFKTPFAFRRQMYYLCNSEAGAHQGRPAFLHLYERENGAFGPVLR